MKKRIAFFDFDGTITIQDTFLDLIKFRHGWFKTCIGLLLISPVYTGYLLKIIPVQTAKEKVMKRFFKDMIEEQFQLLCNEYIDTRITQLLRPKALHEINLLKELNAELVIISASAENWVKPWANQIGAKTIATRLQFLNGRLTGKFQGKNCRGKEKVSRIMKEFNLSNYDEVYCYGDTKSDKPLLKLATFAFYKPFR